MKCATCNQHFFQFAGSGTQCFECQDKALDDDLGLEINSLLNPSGKVPARFDEDREDY